MDGVAAVLWADAGFHAASPGGISAVLLPEKVTLPATTYQIIVGTSEPTFDTSGLQTTRVQFDCFGSSYADAYAAREALIQALNGYRGALVDGSFLQGALVITSVDFFADAPRQYRCMVEFYLMYNFKF